MPALETEAFKLIFVDQQDIDVDEAMVEEMYFSHIARHPLHILDQTPAKNIYGEPMGEPVYTTVSPQIPIHIKLDPEVEELNRYGYDRDRDAIVWFCNKILRDRNVYPKVGDRIDFKYTDVDGREVLEHLIINDINAWDFQRQSKTSYQTTAACNRTHKAMIPGL